MRRNLILLASTLLSALMLRPSISIAHPTLSYDSNPECHTNCDCKRLHPDQKMFCFSHGYCGLHEPDDGATPEDDCPQESMCSRESPGSCVAIEEVGKCSDLEIQVEIRNKADWSQLCFNYYSGLVANKTMTDRVGKSDKATTCIAKGTTPFNLRWTNNCYK